jgi:general secretion pathway protein G
MKRGFTMIELIFVIVIIGILAVIAIPKLSATRDDAKIATNLQNLSTCIQDIGAAYTATGTEGDPAAIASCKNLTDAGCFTISRGTSNTDGNITVDGNKTTDQWCVDTTNKAAKRQLTGTHLFGGNKIVE